MDRSVEKVLGVPIKGPIWWVGKNSVAQLFSLDVVAIVVCELIVWKYSSILIWGYYFKLFKIGFIQKDNLERFLAILLRAKSGEYTHPKQLRDKLIIQKFGWNRLWA